MFFFEKHKTNIKIETIDRQWIEANFYVFMLFMLNRKNVVFSEVV